MFPQFCNYLSAYHLVEFPLIGHCHLVWQICNQLGSDDITQPEHKFPDNMYKVWLRTDLESVSKYRMIITYSFSNWSFKLGHFLNCINFQSVQNPHFSLTGNTLQFYRASEILNIRNVYIFISVVILVKCVSVKMSRWHILQNRIISSNVLSSRVANYKNDIQ